MEVWDIHGSIYWNNIFTLEYVNTSYLLCCSCCVVFWENVAKIESTHKANGQLLEVENWSITGVNHGRSMTRCLLQWRTDSDSRGFHGYSSLDFPAIFSLLKQQSHGILGGLAIPDVPSKRIPEIIPQLARSITFWRGQNLLGFFHRNL